MALASFAVVAAVVGGACSVVSANCTFAGAVGRAVELAMFATAAGGAGVRVAGGGEGGGGAAKSDTRAASGERRGVNEQVR